MASTQNYQCSPGKIRAYAFCAQFNFSVFSPFAASELGNKRKPIDINILLMPGATEYVIEAKRPKLVAIRFGVSQLHKQLSPQLAQVKVLVHIYKF